MPRIMLVAVAVVLAGVALTMPPNAGAHADLDRSVPADGATVPASPAQVDIWFTEEVAAGTTANVSGPDGSEADNGEAEIDLFDPDRRHLIVPLKPDLPDGQYTVTWTSVSGEDQDTATGTYSFTINAGATPVASPSPAASPAATSIAGATPTLQPVAPVSSRPTETESRVDTRALAIAVGVGAGAGLLIFAFWRLVKPKQPLR